MKDADADGCCVEPSASDFALPGLSKKSDFEMIWNIDDDHSLFPIELKLEE